MIIKQTAHTYFLAPERSKDIPYLFETIPDTDPAFLRLMFEAYVLSFYQKLEILEDLHTKMIMMAPLFYSNLANAFLSKNMQKFMDSHYTHLKLKKDIISIHRYIFLSHLLTADNKSLRDKGVGLLQDYSISEISAALNYCKKVHKKFPGSAKTAVKNYLKALEKDENKFDLSLMSEKNKLKHLYSSLHIKPSVRADQILFKNSPPNHSIAMAIKILRTEFDADKLYSVIEKYQIPIYEAIKNIKYFSHNLAEKIISNTKSDELVNCHKLLQQKGAAKNKNLFLSMFETAKNISNKPQTANTIRRILPKPNKNIDELYHKIAHIPDEFKNKNLTISKRVAVFIDKSGSMHDYLNIGKAFVFLLGNLSNKENLYVYLFDREARQLDPYGNKNWLEEFDVLKKDEGGSCIGDAFAKMEKNGQEAEIICVISDGNENLSPTYVQGYERYMRTMKIAPYTLFIKTGYFSSHLEDNIVSSYIPCFVTEFTDYEKTMEEISPVICGASSKKTLEKIMSLQNPDSFHADSNN